MKNLPQYIIEDIVRFIDQHLVFSSSKFGPEDFKFDVRDLRPQKEELHVNKAEVTITCTANGISATYLFGETAQFPGDFARDLKAGRFDGSPVEN